MHSLLSKLNHSCVPNSEVVCAFVDAAADVQATRDVRRGEEITIAYVECRRERAGRREYEGRRRDLKERYDFCCDCEKCEEGGEV